MGRGRNASVDNSNCGSARGGDGRASFVWKCQILSGTVSNGTSGVLGVVVDIGTGLGEEEVLAFDGRAAVADVGDKHVGTAADGVGSTTGLAELLGASSDGDGGAVHVHLAVTDLVEPSPGKQSITGRSVVGESKAVAGVTHDRAVANVGVDSLPGVATIKGQRSLATAAVVGSTASDGHGVGLARSPGDNRLALRSTNELVVSLAGKVGARSREGRRHAVVDVGGELVELGAESRRVLHLHVSRAERGEAKKGGSGSGKGLHVGGLLVFVFSSVENVVFVKECLGWNKRY